MIPSRVRVAQVVTRFVAGAGGLTLRGARGLDPGRYETTIVTADGGPLLAEADRAGMEVVRLAHMSPDISPREDVKGFRELTRVLAEGRFDVVHTHSAKAGALGRMAAWKVGVPAIVHTIHGFPFHDFQSRPRRALYVEIERRLGRITDYFLTDGVDVAAEAIRLGIARPERIRPTASAVDPGIPKVSPATRARARRRLGVPDGLVVIGSVGRLDFQKAPLDMVAAFARLASPDVVFVWVGDGSLRREVEAEIARRGLTERFLLLGERGDVPDLLPGLDLFAMSSLYEGLPCALVEAMSCGIPCVATCVNSVHEVLVPGKTGLLVPPADPAALAGALGYLLDRPDIARRLALAGQAQLADRFRPEALADDMSIAYELALGTYGPPVEERPARPA